jgi:hypothetical protein
LSIIFPKKPPVFFRLKAAITAAYPAAEFLAILPEMEYPTHKKKAR